MTYSLKFYPRSFRSHLSSNRRRGRARALDSLWSKGARTFSNNKCDSWRGISKQKLPQRSQASSAAARKAQQANNPKLIVKARGTSRLDPSWLRFFRRPLRHSQRLSLGARTNLRSVVLKGWNKPEDKHPNQKTKSTLVAFTSERVELPFKWAAV